MLESCTCNVITLSCPGWQISLVSSVQGGKIVWHLLSRVAKMWCLLLTLAKIAWCLLTLVSFVLHFLTHLLHFLLSSGVDGFIKGIDPDKVCEIRAAS